MQEDPFKSLADMARADFRKLYEVSRGSVQKEFKQKNESWCGPAALSYAFMQQGLHVPQKVLADFAKTTMENGTNDKNMVREARRFGFNVKIYEGGTYDATIRALDQALLDGKSVILDYLDGNDIHNDGHYIVYQGSTGNKVIIWDPWKGRNVVLKKEEFNKHWIDEEWDGEELMVRWAMVISKPIW